MRDINGRHAKEKPPMDLLCGGFSIEIKQQLVFELSLSP
jgi:hypothetical protein